jgi:hypothetical protein
MTQPGRTHEAAGGEGQGESSLLMAMLRERTELKKKEISLVEEHEKELGRYVLVFVKPAKLKFCRCKDYQFKSGQFVYRFAHAYLVSDKLTRVGGGCKHYNYPPSPEEIKKDLARFLRATNPTFFQECEAYLEEKFEQAFGAA